MRCDDTTDYLMRPQQDKQVWIMIDGKLYDFEIDEFYINHALVLKPKLDEEKK